MANEKVSGDSKAEEKKSTRTKKQYVLPHERGWQVKLEGSTKATKVFLKYANLLHTPELAALPVHDPDAGVIFTQSAQDSMKLNAMRGPAIILSASGMCNAGRIRHHLKHNLWRPGVSIVFVGYQAVGTPGRKLVDGAKSLRLFGEDVAVAAKIYTIGGFSAHAGQSQLLEWIGEMARPDLKIALVHGEPKAQQILAGLIKERFGITPFIPEYLEEVVIEGSGAPVVDTAAPPLARKHVDWNFLTTELEQRVSQIRDRLADAASLPWEEQAELRDRLSEIERELFVFLSRL